MKMMRSIYRQFANSSSTRPALQRRIRRFSPPIGEHYPLVGVSGILELSHHQSTNRERTNREETEKRSTLRVRHVWLSTRARKKEKGIEFYPILSSGHKIFTVLPLFSENTVTRGPDDRPATRGDPILRR